MQLPLIKSQKQKHPGELSHAKGDGEDLKTKLSVQAVIVRITIAVV